MNPLNEKRHTVIHGLEEHQTIDLGEYINQVEERLKSWKKQHFSRRLWSKDPLLWFPEPKPEITDRLGWLVLPELMREKLEELILFAEKVKNEGISHVVLL